MEQSHKPDQYSRRDILKSVGKYAGAATGASIVAISAEQALAQNASSNPCYNPNPPKRCFGTSG
ncbi:hypothetical protein SAMN06265173_1663 [Thalassovita litoralis]|jgi:hypothetical protein|uniref:Tat (Twin-arginine translocation) pathway signal sequence n=1 Tax=Thalassovita litoralis TaxID=1010611 RepID=A0A521FV66_9RHOB|nr:hypothetical protein [Thalassovita litoralis]SMO99994.1 hypothetical protein SAMN06265173_1663 [Thalassovita litoralis]